MCQQTSFEGEIDHQKQVNLESKAEFQNIVIGLFFFGKGAT